MKCRECAKNGWAINITENSIMCQVSATHFTYANQDCVYSLENLETAMKMAEEKAKRLRGIYTKRLGEI